jgi:hypothetical protein
MVLPGHLSGGYLATRALLSLSHAAFTPGQTLALYIIGTLAGDGPDIDLLWYSFRHRILGSKVEDDHRRYVTHAPFLWLIACLIIVGIGWLCGSVFTEFIGWVILVGSWSHLILDSIEHGVMWLWPLSSKLYFLREVNEPEVPGQRGSILGYWNYIVMVYPKRVTFYIEIAVTLVGLYVLFH